MAMLSHLIQLDFPCSAIGCGGIMRFVSNVAEDSGTRLGAPTVREGLAASARLIRQRPRSPLRLRLVRVRTRWLAYTDPNMRSYTCRPFYEPESEELRFLPEGPRVLQNFGDPEPLLGWVAIQYGAGKLSGSFNLLNLETRANRTFELPGRPGFFAETSRSGIVVVGMERRLVLLDLKTGHVEETGIEVTADERIIINDGIPIPGGLLFGTKHLEFNQKIAALYHYDCESKRVTQLVDKQICSNGKFFQDGPQGPTVIDIDSAPRTITRYQFDRSLKKILQHSLVVAPESLPAVPDGMRPGPDGSTIVVAYYNPDPVDTGLAQEIRLSDGAVLTQWTFPGSPRVTCPEFVQLDGKVCLIFTTADEGMDAVTRAISPAAGTLFRAETPFESMPEPPPLVPVESFLA